MRNAIAKYESHIIWTSPGGGSTLRCELLAATNVAGNPDSCFHRPSIADWLADLGVTREGIFSDHFSRSEPGVFAPRRDTLLTQGHLYMHLADLAAYLEADRKLVQLYADREGWARKTILNVARSGKFSSDRTIAEYAAEIWHAKACPVE